MNLFYKFVFAVGVLTACVGSSYAQEWTEWQDFATGTYDAHYWYRQPMKDRQVQFRHQVANKDMEQYKIIGLFGDESPAIDLIVNVNKAVKGPKEGDYSLWIDPTYIESFDVYGTKQSIYLSDGYTYYENYFPNNPEYAMAYEDASYFREETGTFVIYAYYHYLDGTVPFLDAFYQDQAQGEETFTMKAPQFKVYDLTLSGARFGLVDDTPYFLCNLELNDLSKVRMTIISGSVGDVRSIAEKMNSGTIDYFEATKSGSVQVPFDAKKGRQTLVYLTYKADGTPYQFKSVNYAYDPDWKSLGTGSFTDGFICKFLEKDITQNLGITISPEDITYPVEIQESLSTPGLYRVVNPYGETSPYWNVPFTNIKLDKNEFNYLTINATDPEKVYIEYSNSGFYYGAYPLELYSYAAEWLEDGYSADNIPEYLWGKNTDGIIRFAAGEEDSELLAARILFSPAAIYGQELVVRLPGADGVQAPVATLGQEGVKYYNLQGLEVKSPAPGSICIMRKADGTSSKILVK